MGYEFKKSWTPLTFLIIFFGAFMFFLFSNFESSEVRTPSTPVSGCVVMKDRGNYEDSLNIVFLPENYKNVDNFIQDTERFMESFLQVVPINEYSDRFNFFRIEDLNLDLKCDYSNDAVVCDPLKIKSASVPCPFDYPSVLVQPKGVQNFFGHLRSSSWRGTTSINTGDDPLVYAHEAAHQMFGLLDEYTWQGGVVYIEGPNCDSSINDCPKFSNVEGSECHVGCVNFKHSRPIDVGIMSNYWESQIYGVFDESVIRDSILSQSKNLNSEEGQVQFSQTKGGPPMEDQMLLNLISFSCDFQDVSSCKIEEITQGVQGYPTAGKGEGLLLVQGEKRISIPYGGFSDILHIEPGLPGDLSQKDPEYIPGRIKDIIFLPFEENEEKIYLYDSEENLIDSMDYVPSPEIELENNNLKKNINLISEKLKLSIPYVY